MVNSKNTIVNVPRYEVPDRKKHQVSVMHSPLFSPCRWRRLTVGIVRRVGGGVCIHNGEGLRLINAIAGYKEPANLTRYQHMGREQVTIRPAKGGRLNEHTQPWSKEPHNHPDHRSRHITRDTRKQISLVIDAKVIVRTPALPRTTPPTQSSPGNDKGTHTSTRRNTASYTSSTS